MQATEISYTFHPVGQGVFSSGAIVPIEKTNNPFWWVFDCGTCKKSHFEHIETEVEILAQRIGGRRASQKPKIDLVFISHFDEDHVNGLLRLLERFNVGRLIFPFVSLYERLLIALPKKNDPRRKGDILHRWQRFILNPTGYIESNRDVSVDRVSIVPSSGTEGPSEPADADGEPVSWGDGDPVVISPLPAPPPDEVSRTDDMFSSRIRIEWLAPSTTLKIGNFWEFVPYNRSSPASRLTPEFIPKIKDCTSQLLKAKDPIEQEKLQNEIIELYGERFGTRHLQKNHISLFVYAGPIQKSEKIYDWVIIGPTTVHASILPWVIHTQLFTLGKSLTDRLAKALLLTGDGYLENPTQLRKMIAYFGAHRIELAKVLQVMHHGARTSWHPGVAAALAPEHSIFCAYPHGCYYHPHRLVFQDFEQYGPRICGAERTDGFSLYQLVFS